MHEKPRLIIIDQNIYMKKIQSAYDIIKLKLSSNQIPKHINTTNINRFT